MAFGEWLTRYKMTDMHETDRSKLLQLMEELPAIEEWRASDDARRKLNHPTVVWRKWKESTKGTKPKKRMGLSGKAEALIEEQQARIEELEEERRGEVEELRELLARVLAEVKKLPTELRQAIEQALNVNEPVKGEADDFTQEATVTG